MLTWVGFEFGMVFGLFMVCICCLVLGCGVRTFCIFYCYYMLLWLVGVVVVGLAYRWVLVGVLCFVLGERIFGWWFGFDVFG